MRYRLNTFRVSLEVADAPNERAIADSPAHVEPIARAIFETLPPDQEHLVALYLDTRLRVLGSTHHYSGTLDRSLCEPRAILRDAILSGAAGIVLAHNHPSGDPSPSPDDRAFTRRMVAAAEIVGLRLLDHLIIGQGNGGSASLQKLGLL